MPSKRNQTITLEKDEEKALLSLCRKDFNSDIDGNFTDTLFWGDSFKIMAGLPEKSVDLIIADPPYNLDKCYAGKSFKHMDETLYKGFIDNFTAAAKRLLKPNGTIYVCCDWKDSVIVSRSLSEHFYIRNRITWQRDKGRGSENNWKNCMEDIWYAVSSPTDFVFNLDSVKQRRRVLAPYKEGGIPKDWLETEDGRFRDTYPSNIWDDISVPYWSMKENTEHPTQKPEKLVCKLMLASSNPGAVVLDPFLGSGTTAVVAKKLGRHFVGIESEGRYLALAQKRLAAADGDKTIQGYTDGVFWERNTASEQIKYKN
ncbi:MAG: site-specific DNA-methyltransferase [Ruminococcus sp.]|jgi:site-specific DNA-methyltransferase (adenine-specific)|nr:site-specific DNA-methyltransferase [Ruminococcus sp.]